MLYNIKGGKDLEPSESKEFLMANQVFKLELEMVDNGVVLKSTCVKNRFGKCGSVLTTPLKDSTGNTLYII